MNLSIIPSLNDILSTPEPDYIIPVYPDTKALQSINKRSPETCTKLYSGLSWEIGEDGNRKGVLRFPARTDESVKENWFLTQNELGRNDAVYEYVFLVEKISKELNLPHEKVQELTQKPIENMDILRPYIKEIMTVNSKLINTSSDKIANARNRAIATLIMQEYLVDNEAKNIVWSEEDTDNLPQSLFIELVRYYNGYQEEETNVSEGMTEGESSSDSDKSENNMTINQTGMTSISTSSTGESEMNDLTEITLDVTPVG